MSEVYTQPYWNGTIDDTNLATNKVYSNSKTQSLIDWKVSKVSGQEDYITVLDSTGWIKQSNKKVTDFSSVNHNHTAAQIVVDSSNFWRWLSADIENIQELADEIDDKLRGLKFIWEYSPLIQYYRDDWVRYNWNTYICTSASIGNIPTNTSYFSLFASKWDKWDTGDVWPQWIQGIKGDKWDKWDTWDTWPQGIQWEQWVKGDTWIQWPQWPQWEVWPQWDVWPQWPAWSWTWDMLKSENLSWLTDNATARSNLWAEYVGNKVTDVESNKTSNTLYASVKAIYDWAVGLFYTKAEVNSLASNYYTKTNLDWWQLDNRYYTEAEVNSLANNYYTKTVSDWKYVDIPSNQIITWRKHFSNNDTIFGDETKSQIDVWNLWTNQDVYVDAKSVTYNDVNLHLRPKGAWQLYLEWIINWNNNPDLYKYSIEITVKNFIWNSNFETDVNWWNFWSWTTITRDTTEHYVWTASMRVDLDWANWWIDTYVPWKIGQKFVHSLYVKWTAWKKISMWAWFQQGTWPITLTWDWQRITLSFISSNVNNTLWISNEETTPHTIYIDAVQVEEWTLTASAFTPTQWNLTVSLKNYLGQDPSVSAPVKVQIWDTIRTITSALSYTALPWFNRLNLWSSELATQEVDLFTYLFYRNSTSEIKIAISRIPNWIVRSDFIYDYTNEKWFNISWDVEITDKCVNIWRFNVILSAWAWYSWSIPTTSIIINRPIYETRRLIANTILPSWLGTFTNCSTYMTYRLVWERVEYSAVIDIIDKWTATWVLGFSLPFLPNNNSVIKWYWRIEWGPEWGIMIQIKAWELERYAYIFTYNNRGTISNGNNHQCQWEYFI